MATTLAPISAAATLLQIQTELDIALRYGCTPTNFDHMDREHLEKAFLLVKMLREAQEGGC